MAGFSGVSYLGYRGNNSRIDKVLKQGKQHYKLENVVAQRYKNTIGVYQVNERGEKYIEVVDFYLTNVRDEELYWKTAQKPGAQVSFNSDKTVLTVSNKHKSRKFNIVVM